MTAAVLRVTGAVATEFLVPAFLFAGAFWSLGFALFAGVLAPILLRPRPDGRPG